MKGLEKKVVVLLVLLPLFWGCFSRGPHLSIERGSGSPTGTPGTLPTAIPSLVGNRQFSAGTGSSLYQSEKYKGYGMTTFVFGGRAAGDRYRMVNPELSLGQQQLGESK